MCPSIEKVLNNHLKLSELLIVIFGIPGLLAAGCVSGVLLLGQDPTILVTGVTGVCIAIRLLMVDTADDVSAKEQSIEF